MPPACPPVSRGSASRIAEPGAIVVSCDMPTPAPRRHAGTMSCRVRPRPRCRPRVLAGSLVPLLGLAAALGGPRLAHAQYALGDGHALDANLDRFGGRRVPDSGGFVLNRINNAIVTGNIGGGRGFRGDVGYADAVDFRGNLGSNDLFGFEASSFGSSLEAVRAGRGGVTSPLVGGIGQTGRRRGVTAGPTPGTAAFELARSGSGTNLADLAQRRDGRRVTRLQASTGRAPGLPGVPGRVTESEEDRLGPGLVADRPVAADTALQPLSVFFGPADPFDRTDAVDPYFGEIRRTEPFGTRPATDDADEPRPGRIDDALTGRIDLSLREGSEQGEDEPSITPRRDRTSADEDDPPSRPPEPDPEPGEGERDDAERVIPETLRPGDDPLVDEIARIVSEQTGLPLPSSAQEPYDPAVLEAVADRLGVDTGSVRGEGAGHGYEAPALLPPPRDRAPQPAFPGDAGPDAAAAGPDYEQAMRRGLARLEAGEGFAARRAFSSALAARPDDPIARRARFEASLQVGLFRSAGDDLVLLMLGHPEIAWMPLESDTVSRDRLEAAMEAAARHVRAALSGSEDGMSGPVWPGGAALLAWTGRMLDEDRVVAAADRAWTRLVEADRVAEPFRPLGAQFAPPRGE